MRRIGIAAGSLAMVGLLAAGCGSSKSSSSSATTTKAGGGACPSGAKIGFFGALTGSDAALGINERNGVKLALDQYKKASGCDIKLEEYDSQGSPDQAPALATKAVGDKNVLAIVGPAFSGESKVADPIFDEAGLPEITASATNVTLSTNGWKIFHRAVANDGAQGPAAAKYILGAGKKKVAVIDDASEYGKGLADQVKSKIPAGGGAVAVSDTIDPKGSDFSSTVTKVKAAGVDAVFYGGYYDAAGRLMKQLRDAGVQATFVAGDGSLDAKFVDSAGATAAEGAILLAPGAYTAKDASFASAYKALNGVDPALYSGEAYDAANHILAAIKAGKTTRADINAYIGSTPYTGLLKTYKYQANGELEGGGDIIQHTVQGGKIQLVGPVK
jgi:branched-chain amino acid transport system substrate-binding protein